MSDLGSARTPTAILEARGAYTKHPERRHQGEPDTGRGVGPPPDYLTDEEKNVWNQTVAMCAPGVFQSSDAHALEVYSRIMAEFHPKKTRGRPKTPTFANLKVETLLKFWARFGMTPGDRTRVSVAVQPGPASGRASGVPTGLAKFTTRPS